MNATLKRIKDIRAENCITITLNTHRTIPDNQKDPILLKNLIKNAEQRLLADENKKTAQNLIQRLHDLKAKIDHSLNIESLVLFVNEDIAEYVRLPIFVEDRVVIDNTFTTRDMIRSLHLQNNYFVLVLSQQKVRLTEAFNDKVVSEVGEPFPIENAQLFSTSRTEASYPSRQTNLVAEFFNRTDKEVNAVRKDNPLPVLICTEQSNYYEYLKIADQKNSIFDTYLNGNRVEEKAHHIVAEAWKIVKQHTEKRTQARKEELKRAIGTGKFLSDINDIWRAIPEGRIQTLFIEQGLFQPGIMEKRTITLVPEEDRNKKGVVDDIYDEMIEENMNHGGDVVFLPKGELSEFNGFGAVTRY